MATEQLTIRTDLRYSGAPGVAGHDVEDHSFAHSERFIGPRLEAALSLAWASSAHLSCVHATPIQAYVTSDSLGGIFVMNDVIRVLEEEDARLRSRSRAGSGPRM